MSKSLREGKLMDVTESQDTVVARSRTAPSSEGLPSTEAPGEAANAQQSTFADLLDLARGALDGESPKTATALSHVLQYRDQVLAAGRPELLSETLPLVRAIEARSVDRVVTEEARHFVASTVRRMAASPEQARTFEVEALQAELDQIQDRQSQTLPRLLPLAALVVSVAGVTMSTLVAPRLATDHEAWNLVGLILMPAGVVLAALLEVSRRASEASLNAQADNVERKLNLRRLPGSLDNTYAASSLGPEAATPGGDTSAISCASTSTT